MGIICIIGVGEGLSGDRDVEIVRSEGDDVDFEKEYGYFF